MQSLLCRNVKGLGFNTNNAGGLTVMKNAEKKNSILAVTTTCCLRKIRRIVIRPLLPVVCCCSCFLVPISSFLFPIPSYAVETIPYFNASVLGGQYFFGSQEGAVSGNISAVTSSSMKLSPEFVLIPLYSGKYQGTKNVTDIVGGGTLFQEAMDHRIAVKGVYEYAPELKFKPEIGFKWYLLKETRDEKWGKGLFDYQKPSFSLETEFLYNDPFSIRLGYDLFKMSFLNYTSLESQIGATDGSMAREMSGSEVLNSMNHNFSLAGNADMGGSVVEMGIGYLMRGYNEQHVVNSIGQFDSDKRSDTTSSVNFNWKFPNKTAGGLRIIPGMGFGLAFNRSNQNNYDAQRVTFISNYYNYDRASFGLDLGISVPSKVKDSFTNFRFNAGLTRTNYGDRPVQDEAGLYETGRVANDELVFGGSVTYPIIPAFNWMASMQYGKQFSNMKYEKLYKYNFNVMTYLVGFTYEY